MLRKYDESLQAIQEMQQAGTAVYRVEDMEFGRRLAIEKEVDADERALATMNAVWDESGNFVIYPTLLGIKGEPGPLPPSLATVSLTCVLFVFFLQW